jgi:hypothetical protein
MLDEKQADQRQTPRFRVDQPGTAVLDSGASIVCTIVDMGALGARLEFNESDCPLPRRFELLLADSDAGARVRVLWQHGTWVGVLFEPEIPARKPGLWGWINSSLGLS